MRTWFVIIRRCVKLPGNRLIHLCKNAIIVLISTEYTLKSFFLIGGDGRGLGIASHLAEKMDGHRMWFIN